MPYNPSAYELEVIVSSIHGNVQLLQAAKESGTEFPADLTERISLAADNLLALVSPAPADDGE